MSKAANEANAASDANDANGIYISFELADLSGGRVIKVFRWIRH